MKHVTLQDLQKADAQVGYLKPFLRCRQCGAHYSATPGDYFWMPEDRVFTCDQDGEPLQLVTKHTEYREVTV